MSDLDVILQRIKRIPGVDKVIRVGKNEHVNVYVPGLGNCNMVNINVYHKVEELPEPTTLGIKVEDGITAKAIFNPKGDNG